MNIEQATLQLGRVLAAHGADSARWPSEARDWFVQLDGPMRRVLARRMAGSEAAGSEAARLDRLLDRVTVAPADATLTARILAEAGRIGAIRAPDAAYPPFPRLASGVPNFAGVPNFGWPSAGMLAAAAVLGFVLGWFEPVFFNDAAAESAANQALFDQALSGQALFGQPLFGLGDWEIET